MTREIKVGDLVYYTQGGSSKTKRYCVVREISRYNQVIGIYRYTVQEAIDDKDLRGSTGTMLLTRLKHVVPPTIDNWRREIE